MNTNRITQKMIIVIFCLTLMVLFSVTGCAPGRNVQRIAADETMDLSGRWNDTDSRLVAEEMISDVLARPWLSNFTSRKSKQPVVIVGRVRNLSSEHIDTTTFVKNMERELLNSGSVRFVASKEDRAEIREERLDQQTHATEESAARLAAETGADFMLQGGIRTIIDAVEGKQIKFYQVDLELIDMESNDKVWLGNKEIKKFITQSKRKF